MDEVKDLFFSIAIPAYKSQYLKECVESILHQSYKHFELIIVNDCSPNPVKNIVENFNDNRIVYFENTTNTGAENVVDNWNICLKKAEGEFFILMGDDDKLEPDYLSTFFKLIHEYPNLDVYHCRTLIINENSLPVKLTAGLPVYESVYDAIWHRLRFGREQFISDFVYRTKTLKAQGGFFKLPYAWGSDDITSYQMTGAKGIAHINLPLFQYRTNRNNITATGNAEIKRIAVIQLLHWLNEFISRNANTTIDEIIRKSIKNSLAIMAFNTQIEFIDQILNKQHFFKGLVFLRRYKNKYLLQPQLIYKRAIRYLVKP